MTAHARENSARGPIPAGGATRNTTGAHSANLSNFENLRSRRFLKSGKQHFGDFAPSPSFALSWSKDRAKSNQKYKISKIPKVYFFCKELEREVLGSQNSFFDVLTSHFRDFAFSRFWDFGDFGTHLDFDPECAHLEPTPRTKMDLPKPLLGPERRVDASYHYMARPERISSFIWWNYPELSRNYARNYFF